ncbi:MAG: PAS domain-containing protein, partial [Rhodothermales bacterium]
MSVHKKRNVQVVETLEEWRKEQVNSTRKAASRRAFEDRFQALARPNFDVAYECRIDLEAPARICKALNEALQKISGFSSKALVERGGWEAVVHPEDQAVVVKHLRRVLDGCRDVCVFRIVTRSGRERWLGNLVRPVWDEASLRVVHLYGLMKDLSAYRYTCDVLHDSDPDA